MKILSLILSVLFIFPFTAYSADNSASCAIVIDASSKTILYEKNAYEERAIASTTKIMTALLAVESGRLDETVKINSEMLAVEGSSLGLKENDTLTLYDLTVGMMLTSGNDSANAVAISLAGSIEDFAVMMNNRADEIGMKNTYFVTPSGLDEGNHHSTAYDMALLTVQAVKNDIFCEIVSSKSADITVSGEKVTVYNHNRLLSMDDNIFGVKTGYTEKAGRCLVSAENYNGNVLICVTLNCPNDWEDHLSLYDECEDEYAEQKVNCEKTVNAVGAKCDTFTCSYKGKYYTLFEITVYEYIYPFVYAPIKKGEKVGEAHVYCNDILLERLPITANEDVEFLWQEAV